MRSHFKTLCAAFTCFAAMAGASQPAQADIGNSNPNAVAETLIRSAITHGGGQPRQLVYVDSENVSLVCKGRVPQEGINVFDAKGKGTYSGIRNKIDQYVNDPNAKDKVTQARLKKLVSENDHLVLVQYETSFGPTPKELEAYFTQNFGKPHDVYSVSDGGRGGRMITHMLVDEAAYGKFYQANAGQIEKLSATYTNEVQKTGYGPARWSQCGPGGAK